MHTANHKPVSESTGLADEKTPKCKAFAGIKLISGKLIGPLHLPVKVSLVISSGAQVNSVRLTVHQQFSITPHQRMKEK